MPEAKAIVKNSSTITTPELGETLKATIGCGDINGRTLNRLCHVIRSEGEEQESKSYRKLADYVEKNKATSGGTITDCQVNCVHVGVMRGLRVLGWPWSKLIAHTVLSACSNANTRMNISIRFAVSFIPKFESQTCGGD